MILLTGASSTVNVAIIAVFLARLLDWDPATWRTFAIVTPAWCVVLVVVAQRLQRPVHLLARWLDREATEGTTREEDVAAFGASIDLVRQVLVNSYLLWPLGALAVALTMKILSAGVMWADVLALLAAGAMGGVVSSPTVAFLFKREVEPLRARLARLVEDPELRARAAKPLSLVWKLQGTVLVTTVVPVLVMLTVVQRQLGASLEEFVQVRQHAWLDTLAGAPGAAAAASESARRSGSVEGWAVLDGRSGDVLAGEATTLSAEQRSALARSDETRGQGSTASHLFSWRRLEGNRLVVASLPREVVSGSWRRLAPEVLGLLVLALAVACSAAWIVSQDLGRGIRALRTEAERIAAGDLSRPEVFESEDELGDLGRAFDRMRQEIRDTVGRVAQAADRVDAAAIQMATVGSAVAGAAADQERAVAHARDSTDTVRAQAGDITSSAQELSASVEESSSSILEMGAAGEELNQTASVLSAKVDEVSTSIEQMIRSVSEMARNVEGLSEATIETQSSVEEMAGSMRDVDANAAETARLSAQVVVMAEGGREKVQETIAGMEAIRDATDTVEQVIRGLGERTKEIGAIVDVIDDVADETNLLALNAAIIAAQAGEHGRAFSVVADEIKDLADRVMSSTKEIGGLIRSVQTESAAAISAIERGSESVWVGVERSAEAGESLEAITGSARESGQRIAEIVQGVQEQARAASHVQALMERVRASIEQLRAATREQEQGNETVLGGIATMRDVSQQVHRTTEEQARGGNQIRQGVEVVRQAVERIYQALQDQASACQQTANFMTRVSAAARANHESAERVEGSTSDLRDAAQTLREEIRRFRL
jgi:methyl-accepting chemotaxis protein